MAESKDDEQQIHRLFERGDRALMAADIDTLAAVFAEDYVQYDAAGRPSPKRDVLEGLRSSGCDIRRSYQPGGRFGCLGTWLSCMDPKLMKSRRVENGARFDICIWMCA